VYTVALLNPKTNAYKLAYAMQDRIQKDGQFRVSRIEVGQVKTSREERRTLGKVYTCTALLLHNIRLTKMRPFCGSHPGECLINPFTGKEPDRPNSTLLEWADWVEFHKLINGVLSQRHTSANIWTIPRDRLDQGRRMWIRRGLLPRVKWEWEESYDHMGRREQVWDHGSPSQFSP
jgi:hypothetical protein